ncbi:MAG: glycosyltransferase [Cytophagaceae bacterium]
MKHCLYLSYDGLTDFLGQSQVLPYILGLEKSGYTYTIISFEKPDKFQKDEVRIRTLIQGKNIQWIPLTYHKKFSILATLYDVFCGLSKVNSIHKTHPIDLIHSRSYIATLIAWLFYKSSQTPFIFDMRGFWADERVEGGIWNLKNPVFNITYKLFKSLEAKYIRDAAAIISLTHNGVEEMLRWKIRSKESFQVIPCCADLSLFNKDTLQPATLESLKNKININSNQQVVLYLGSVGTWYLLDEMLDFFKAYDQRNPNALFLFVTGDDPEFIYTAAEQKNIHRDKLRIVSASKPEVPYYISCANLSILFIKPSFSKKASSPTKLPEILAMEVPVICNDLIGDMTQQVKECNGGLIISTFNDSTYNDALDKLSRQNIDHEHLHAYLNTHFALDMGVAKYKEVYQKILGQ